MRVLQRDALHKRNTSCRRVSVCHSCVNIVSKRRKISSIIISHPGSPVIHVVFPHYTNTCEILAGAEACNTGGLRKIHNFLPISRFLFVRYDVLMAQVLRGNVGRDSALRMRQPCCDALSLAVCCMHRHAMLQRFSCVSLFMILSRRIRHSNAYEGGPCSWEVTHASSQWEGVTGLPNFF